MLKKKISINTNKKRRFEDEEVEENDKENDADLYWEGEHGLEYYGRLNR